MYSTVIIPGLSLNFRQFDKPAAIYWFCINIIYIGYQEYLRYLGIIPLAEQKPLERIGTATWSSHNTQPPSALRHSIFIVRYSPFLGHPPSVLEFTQEFIPGSHPPDSQQGCAGFSVSLPGVLFPGKSHLSDNLEQPNLPFHRHFSSRRDGARRSPAL